MFDVNTSVWDTFISTAMLLRNIRVSPGFHAIIDNNWAVCWLLQALHVPQLAADTVHVYCIADFWFLQSSCSYTCFVVHLSFCNQNSSTRRNVCISFPLTRRSHAVILKLLDIQGAVVPYLPSRHCQRFLACVEWATCPHSCCSPARHPLRLCRGQLTVQLSSLFM